MEIVKVKYLNNNEYLLYQSILINYATNNLTIYRINIDQNDDQNIRKDF